MMVIKVFNDVGLLEEPLCWMDADTNNGICHGYQPQAISNPALSLNGTGPWYGTELVSLLRDPSPMTLSLKVLMVYEVEMRGK